MPAIPRNSPLAHMRLPGASSRILASPDISTFAGPVSGALQFYHQPACVLWENRCSLVLSTDWFCLFDLPKAICGQSPPALAKPDDMRNAGRFINLCRCGRQMILGLLCMSALNLALDRRCFQTGFGPLAHQTRNSGNSMKQEVFAPQAAGLVTLLSSAVGHKGGRPAVDIDLREMLCDLDV